MKPFIHSSFAFVVALFWPFVTQAAEFQPPAFLAVALKPEIAVQGPVVRLGDIFAGLADRNGLASTPVAKAPELGRKIELDAAWLAALARSYGVNWRPRSAMDHAVLERASRRVPPEEIRRALIEALKARGAGDALTMNLDNPSPEIILPAENEPSFTVRDLVYDGGSGRFFAQIVSPAEGPVEARVKVSGDVLVMTEVPVLARRIAPGEIIEQEDIAWQSRRADRLPRNGLTQVDDLLGLTPRRPILAGRLIRSGDLKVPVAVAKNSLVTLHLVTANMTLTTQGRALEDGSMGEAIRVMNTKSGQVVTAVTRGSGKVEVITASLAASN